MVKPPVVYLAGMLRHLRRAIDTAAWTWLADGMGQRLFRPPNVSGWDDDRWLDTSTLRGPVGDRGRGHPGRHLTDPQLNAYDPAETPAQAVAAALAFWGNPLLTSDGRAALDGFAATCLPAVMANWEQRYYRGIRQNALRHLIAVSPDLQTS